MKLIVNYWWLNRNRKRLVCETVWSKYLVTTFLYILLIVFAQLNIKIIKLLVKLNFVYNWGKYLTKETFTNLLIEKCVKLIIAFQSESISAGIVMGTIIFSAVLKYSICVCVWMFKLIDSKRNKKKKGNAFCILLLWPAFVSVQGNLFLFLSTGIDCAYNTCIKF